jgi:hypothetical protein
LVVLIFIGWDMHMNIRNRYFTKSKFKIASECPTRLFYLDKPQYINQHEENPFLEALAKGGYQAGELAKKYYPNGHDLGAINSAEAIAKTKELLQLDEIVIFEAAIQYKNLLIRVDILTKNNNQLQLIEVKAKSFDFDTEDPFLTQKGFIQSGWFPYLNDVAFQKHVLISAFPENTITSYLMLIDKKALSPTDGLNQKFKVIKNHNNHKSIDVSSTLDKDDLSVQLLKKINVDFFCDLIFSGNDSSNPQSLNFSDRIHLYADHYAKDIKIITPISSTCSNCPYTATFQDPISKLISGFHECWKNELGWSDSDFEEPTILNLWNFRKKDLFIQDRKIKFSQLAEGDINPTSTDYGLSTTERQWLQIEKSQQHDKTPWLDKKALIQELNSWEYPLHFIDFETTMTALPFNKGRHPYEGIAFQFSHHKVLENGQVLHQGEYLNSSTGVFPNYEFVRALKQELDKDNGTIFRYATHENTFLNIIYWQLKTDTNEIFDRDELCSFIRSITVSTGDSVEKWEGERNMVDMLDLVKHYYYNPLTNGSNSIKYVLPATLESSDFLKSKYSKPIYGAKKGIPSYNFKNWKWIHFDNDKMIDPYKLLPNIDLTNDRPSNSSNEAIVLQDGGAAMTAYARLQFEDLSETNRQRISQALLRYCELDTFAMVMLYEAWRDWLL